MNTEPLECPFTPPPTPPPQTQTATEAQPVAATPVPTRVRTKKKMVNIRKSDIRRCARQGGVKRMTPHTVDVARAALVDFMTTIIKDATVYTMHASRKTVITNDILYALKKNGRTLYR
jgi:histone H4